jgi:hypothetical protein
MNKIAYAIENFKNMQELIRFADQKASAIVVVYGFIISITYETSKSLTLYIPNISTVSTLGTAAFVVGLVLTCMVTHQIYILFQTILKPKLAMNYNRNDSCLYYFEHVAAQNKSEVMSCFVELDERAMLSDVASQIYEVSNTLVKKMEMVSKAIDCLTWVVLLMVVYVLLARTL